MFPNGAAGLALILSLKEEDDGNKDLKEFYESNLSSFFNCPWDFINYPLIRNIAVKIEATLPDREEWRAYATAMKVDNKTISYAYVRSLYRQDQPIFFIMDKILKNKGTFGHIIHALLELERFDVLKEIEPDVRGILSKILQTHNNNSASSTTCENAIDGNCTVKKNSTSFREQKCDMDNFQQHSINESFKNICTISYPSKPPDGSSEEIKVPSAPEEEKMIVLIQHSESENTIAEDLSNQFSREDVIAITFSKVITMMRLEPSSVLQTIFEDVDFIVPILSKNFMQDIYPESSAESIFAEQNRNLFDLMRFEYENNRCVNKRVRPVIVEEMNRKEVRDPIFRYPFKLPKEVPKLIRVLKETKEIIKNLD